MFQILVQPTENAITNLEARAYLRIAQDGDDNALGLLIRAAIERVENKYFKAFVNRKLRQSFEKSQINHAIDLANKMGANIFLRPQLGNISAISNVKILNFNNVWEIAPVELIKLVDDKFELSDSFINSNFKTLEIEYWAGFSNADLVPRADKLLILEELSRIIQARDNEDFNPKINAILGARL
jgi:hypothetical protein